MADELERTRLRREITRQDQARDDRAILWFIGVVTLFGLGFVGVLLWVIVRITRQLT